MNIIRLTGGPHLGAGNLTLTGAGAGFLGATMTPSSGPGPTVEQVIDIEFGDTEALIESGMVTLGLALTDAEVEAAKPGGDLVYVECQVTATDAFYRSPIYSGWFELTGAGADLRANGSQNGKLHLIRANWWETSSEVTLVSEQTIDNHRDSGHTSIVTVAAQAGDADLPAAARLVFNQSGAVNAAAGLFVGMRSGPPGVLDLYFEGQDGAAREGVTGSTVSDSASSNGSYFNLAWSGSAETRLWQVDIPAAQTAIAAGKPFRAVLRLGGVLPSTASEKMWARWELCYLDAGGTECFLYESPGKFLEPATQIIFGPVLYIPPWVPKATTPDLRVVLKVAAAGSGAHSIKFDYVDFAPLDGWRQYEPALQKWGVYVEDYGQVGMAGEVDGMMTHSMEGPGFKIYPGNAHQFQFYLYYYLGTSITAAGGLNGLVSLYYRPRKRGL